MRVLPIQIEHRWQDISPSTPPPSDLSADQNGRRFRYTQHVSRRVLMTMLNAHTPLGANYTALVQTARWKRGIIPPLHE